MQAVFEKIIEHLENASFWTDSSFDEDGYCNDDSEEAVYLHKAIEIVKQEADKYNNGWIPCSERLPEVSGEYYTYVYYDGHYMYSVDEIDCDGMVKRWNYVSDYKVVAWKPIEQYQLKGE